jgi:hypothetical protein
MVKYFLVIPVLLFSFNSIAYTNEQLGSKMADCAGWYISTSFVMRDAGNSAASAEYMSAGNDALGIATKLIGKTKASDFSVTGMREYNQNKANGTLESWLPRLLSKKNECDAYTKNNMPQLRKALGQ